MTRVAHNITNLTDIVNEEDAKRQRETPPRHRVRGEPNAARYPWSDPRTDEDVYQWFREASSIAAGIIPQKFKVLTDKASSN